jgi:heme/copper-type cytochrome/quinol oxidase subunit 2
MDFISILATILLFTTVATLAIALAAYAAFKMREKRKPGKKQASATAGQPALEPIFLERYVPDADDFEPVATDSAR